MYAKGWRDARTSPQNGAKRIDGRRPAASIVPELHEDSPDRVFGDTGERGMSRWDTLGRWNTRIATTGRARRMAGEPCGICGGDGRIANSFGSTTTCPGCRGSGQRSTEATGMRDVTKTKASHYGRQPIKGQGTIVIVTEAGRRLLNERRPSVKPQPAALLHAN